LTRTRDWLHLDAASTPGEEDAMRIVVNRDLCEGNAVCQNVAPEVFVVDDDDQAQVKMEHPDEALRPKIETAVRRCPRQALSIVEE